MGNGGVGFLGPKQHEMLPVFLVDFFLGFCRCYFGVRLFLGVVLEESIC